MIIDLIKVFKIIIYIYFIKLKLLIMEILNGKEILDYEGIFIKFNDEGVGMFISEDKDLNFSEFEGCGDDGTVELSDGKIIKWGILFN